MWLLYASPAALARCDSLSALSVRSEGLLGVWLNGEREQVQECLLAVRRDCMHAHLPVFVDQELPAKFMSLCDGVVKSAEDAAQKAAHWRPDPATLRGDSASAALALARYLYLRPETLLTPLRDTTAHQAYRYPVLDAFADGESPQALLNTLRTRGWLESRRQVDRLRRCEDCHSVHLNYVDVCPSCHGLNVESAAFIHCFTCSHVAPQENFVAGSNLVCPNCNARLRHVGADYNRPLEQLSCHDCHASFAEAEVVARCLGCGRSHEPEKLPVITMTEYALSDAGRSAARQGVELAWQPPAAGIAQGMETDAFISMTDWLMSVSRRHGQAEFSLIGLYLSVPEGFARRLGEAGMAAMLDAFSARLHELVRDTDIITRAHDHLFWIVLPQTSRAGAKSMLKKIMGFAEATTQEDGSRLGIRGVVHAAADIPVEFTASRLLESLGSRLQGAIHADRTA